MAHLQHLQGLSYYTSWTATEDCYLFGAITSMNGATINIYINGQLLTQAFNTQKSVYCFMKKGDIMTMSRDSENNTSMIVHAYTFKTN